MKRTVYKIMLEAMKTAALSGVFVAIAAITAGAQGGIAGMLLAAGQLLMILLLENVILGWIGKVQMKLDDMQPNQKRRKDRRQTAEMNI